LKPLLAIARVEQNFSLLNPGSAKALPLLFILQQAQPVMIYSTEAEPSAERKLPFDSLRRTGGLKNAIAFIFPVLTLKLKKKLFFFIS
jgi:hypothetical protein